MVGFWGKGVRKKTGWKQGEGDMGTKTIEEFVEIIVKEKPNKY